MSYTVIVYIVMAYIVMAYTVMTYVVMANLGDQATTTARQS